MAGKIKQMIDQIIAKRANGNSAIEKVTRTKLVLKGVNPDNFTASSPDDADVMAKVRQIASELGVTI
ncbi:MAG TPA: hypothetical protein DEA44_03535 [Firmicutes bacterium]|nr:hypothetical protein [Bacillota bacterium]